MWGNGFLECPPFVINFHRSVGSSGSLKVSMIREDKHFLARGCSHPVFLPCVSLDFMTTSSSCRLLEAWCGHKGGYSSNMLPVWIPRPNYSSVFCCYNKITLGDIEGQRFIWSQEAWKLWWGNLLTCLGPSGSMHTIPDHNLNIHQSEITPTCQDKEARVWRSSLLNLTKI